MGCSSLLRSLSFPRPSCAPSFDSKHGKQPMSRKTRICSTTTTRNRAFHRTLSITVPIRRNRRINRFGGGHQIGSEFSLFRSRRRDLNREINHSEEGATKKEGFLCLFGPLRARVKGIVESGRRRRRSSLAQCFGFYSYYISLHNNIYVSDGMLGSNNSYTIRSKVGSHEN